MQNDDEQLIKKMAKLLREGATMLNKTCPKCSTLIYRLPNKKIICPSCDSEIVIQKEDSPIQDPTNDPMNSNVHNFNDLLNTIFTKMDDINKKLQNESDLIQIERLTSVIEKLLVVYEKIYKFYLHSIGK